MLRHMEELLAAYDEPLGLTPLERLEYFVRFHIDQNRERSAQVFIAYMELRNLSAENFAEVEALRRAYEMRLESILAAGKRHECVQPAMAARRCCGNGCGCV